MKSSAGAWSVRRVTRLGFLASMGTALFVLESLIPLPLPFLKVGLANISTLVTLIIAGPADAVIVVFLRVLVGSLVTGSFFGPSFILAMSAGVVSAGVMAGVRFAGGRFLGPVGVSLAGSTAHVLTQVTIVALVYVRNGAVIHLLPVLLVTALVGGLVVGIVTARLLPAFGPSGVLVSAPQAHPGRSFTPGDVIAVLLLSACTIGSFAALSGAEGTAVLVEVGGVTIEKLNILENREFTFRGEKGEMRLQVCDGGVRIVEADCPNRICVRTGWRRNEGDVIVCVPNRVVIRITGEQTDRVGAITG